MAPSRASAATTRLIRPISRALSGATMSPVNSNSKASLRLTLRARATPGVMQNRPTLIPEVPKRASLEARARSLVATSWQPAAVAMPWTRAMTGCGSRVMVTIMRLHVLNRCS